MNLYVERNGRISNLEGFEDIIPNLVMPEDNSALTLVPSVEDVKQVVFTMDPNSAPGSNEFFRFVFSSLLGYCW